MSNEELAALIQAGEAERLLDLWNAVNRFAWQKAQRWVRAWEGRGGITHEDLMQCAFLALLDALEGWKPDGGAFLGWYALRLKAAFTAAYGQRTARDRRDPLQAAASLDMPLTDDEGDPFTLADVLPDPAAGAALAEVEERDYLERLHAALEAALADLPEQLQEAVRAKYYWGQDADRRVLGAALRQLRHPRRSMALRKFVGVS